MFDYRKKIKKYERYIFFFLLVVVTVSFGITAEMMFFAGGKTGTGDGGEIFGKKISQGEFLDVQRRWKAMQLLKIDRGMIMQYSGMLKKSPAETMSMLGAGSGRSNGRFFGPFWDQFWPLADELIPLEDQPMNDQATWYILIALHEADRNKIAVSDAELKDTLKAFFGGESYTYELYTQRLEGMRITEEDCEKTFAEFLKIGKLLWVIQSASDVTTKDVLEEYLSQNEQARARFVEIASKDFEKQVKVSSSEELAKYFKENQDSYKTPSEVQIEYVIASEIDMMKDIPEPTSRRSTTTTRPTRRTTRSRRSRRKARRRMGRTRRIPQSRRTSTSP
jgi:hypothetical protein